MTESQPASLRTRVEWADRAARAVLRRPILYTVEVDIDPACIPTELVRCGFFQFRRRWFGQLQLHLCHVHVAEYAGTAVVAWRGCHPSTSYRRMTAAKEHPFSPRPLDLDELVVEPAAARAVLLQFVELNSRVQPRCSGLTLTIDDDQLAWRGSVDVPGHGLHTIMIDARIGVVASHEFLPYGDP